MWNSSGLVRLVLDARILYNFYFFYPSNGSTQMALRDLVKLVLLWLQITYLTQSHFCFGTVHFLQDGPNIQSFLLFARFQINFSTTVSSFNFFYLQVLIFYINEFAWTATWRESVPSLVFVWMLSCVHGNMLEYHWKYGVTIKWYFCSE